MSSSKKKNKKPKKKYLWMLVTSDKYELPVFVEDTAQDLADKVGVTKSTVESSVKHAEKRGGFTRYVRVEYKGSLV